VTDTAVLAQWDALAAVINTGPGMPTGEGPKGPVPLLSNQRVYRGRATGAPAPGPGSCYFLLGAAPEPNAGYYGEGQDGQDGRYRIHCWADTITNANRLYQWLKRLIDGKRLPLEGFTMVEGGELVKLTDAPDDASSAWQVEAEWHAETIEGA